MPYYKFNQEKRQIMVELVNSYGYFDLEKIKTLVLELYDQGKTKEQIIKEIRQRFDNPDIQKQIEEHHGHEECDSFMERVKKLPLRQQQVMTKLHDYGFENFEACLAVVES